MSKLTLSVDPSVTERAKRYAERQGTSVSQLVETYLDLVSRPAEAPEADAPILGSLRGILKRSDVSDYKKHIEKKYR